VVKKTVIITGGGRGIGKYLAQRFATEYNVVLASRSLNEINNTLDEIKNIGGDGIAIQTDVSNFEQVKNLISQTIQTFQKIDVLINNAGMITPIGPINTIDANAWTKTLQINLFGTFYCTQLVSSHMISQNYGKIINLSGGGAFNPFPNFSAYSTSKAAIVRFTETVAKELSKHHIDVNAIAPGAMKTKIMYDVVSSGDMAGEELSRAKKIVEEGGSSLEKVGNLALFLASKESDGLNGKTISAKWDDLDYIKSNLEKIQNSDKFTMKRID